MSRLIDADTFNRFDYSSFDGALSEDAVQGMDTVLNAIDNAPTIDAVPVVHGEWICGYKIDYGGGFRPVKRCSICDSYHIDSIILRSNFCPNCGAKMDGERRADSEKTAT